MQLEIATNPIIDAFARNADINPFNIVIGLALAVLVSAMLATFLRGHK